MRIVSFLPAATEMIFALGLGDDLVGVSHECDFPAEAKQKPVVVKPAVAFKGMTLCEIDAMVSARLRNGDSLYAVDENLLRELGPDLIITQDLCQVCAPSGNEISKVLISLPNKPQVLYLAPHSIAGIFDNILQLGKATGRVHEAESLIAQSRARLEQIDVRTRHMKRQPRVFSCEWIDPVYGSGHWVPEMIQLAGGQDLLSRNGADSVRVGWKQVLNWSPEIFLVSPCGFNAGDALRQAPQLFAKPGWRELPAAQSGRVFAVDANSYFARPGPRVVDGVELLAHLIHPEAFQWRGPADAFQRVET